MIHPSYVELMKVVNDNVEIGEEPVVNSRYSIVAATAKRARQIIDGTLAPVELKRGEKPLSVAVQELYNGDLEILSDETAAEMEEKIAALKEERTMQMRQEETAAGDEDAAEENGAEEE